MKEATKHTPGWTPGPWHLDRDYEAAEGHIGITSADGPREHKGLAQVVIELEGSPYEEGIANAHLIASAPTMAEALRNLVLFDEGKNVGDYHHLIAAARSALSRARGEV
jgi:hypothetical protein